MGISDTSNNPSQSVKIHHSDNRGLSQPISHSNRASRLLVSAAAALLVLASCGFGVTFAWQTGSRHDPVLGIISVAMALGLEISKPFAIDAAVRSLRRWRIFTAAALTLVGLLAVAFSLQAELTFMSISRGDLVAERASEADAAQRAEQRYRRAEAELAALKPTGSTKSATAVFLTRREALQAELRAAEQDSRAAPAVVVADPGSVALATYAAALGWKLDAGELGKWLPLVSVLALEIGAAFAVVLIRATEAPVPVTSVTPEPPRATESPVAAGDAVAREVAQTAQKRKSGAPRAAQRKRRPDDDDDAGGPPKRGLAGLLDAVRAEGGVIDLSQRKLARKLGVPRTTLQRALGQLEDAGRAVLDTSPAGTRVALA